MAQSQNYENVFVENKLNIDSMPKNESGQRRPQKKHSKKKLSTLQNL